jgi:hypothetical protein
MSSGEDPGAGALREEHPLEAAEGAVSKILFQLVQLKTSGQLTADAVYLARAMATSAAGAYPSALEAFEYGVAQLSGSAGAEDAVDDAAPAGRARVR